MARATTPPGRLGGLARHGLPVRDPSSTLLRAAGLRAAVSRFAALDFLTERPQPQSHADLLATLGTQGFDRATVYRNLTVLVSAGLARRADLADLDLLRDGALSVAAIATVMRKPPSLVSQHRGIRRGAGLVRGVRHGRFVVYELFDAHARIFVDSAVAHVRRLGGGTGP